MKHNEVLILRRHLSLSKFWSFHLLSLEITAAVAFRDNGKDSWKQLRVGADFNVGTLGLDIAACVNVYTAEGTKLETVNGKIKFSVPFSVKLGF